MYQNILIKTEKYNSEPIYDISPQLAEHFLKRSFFISYLNVNIIIILL